MAEQSEIHNIDQLYAKINEVWPEKIMSLHLEHQGMDRRINWDSYIVLAKFKDHEKVIGQKARVPVGYTNGDLSTLF